MVKIYFYLLVSLAACLKPHIVAHPCLDLWLFYAAQMVQSQIAQTISYSFFLFVSSAVLCTHKGIFWMVLAMQHETLCAEHISVGYPRAGASLNTSHKPFTTWWGEAASTAESPSHRLKYHRMPRHKPLERPVHVFTHNFCLFRSSTFSSCYQLCWKLFQHQSIYLIGLQLEKLISVTHGNLILCRNTLSYVSYSCNYMCITRQQTLKNTHSPFQHVSTLVYFLSCAL